jgi:predicted flap endonuclease-1-like 5' DNA nuclease
MASVIHIAEIAAILAVAYMLGWIIGYVAHRLFAPKPLVQATIPEARLAAATGTAEALVRAPVIAPVADPAAESPAAAVEAEATATVAPVDSGAAATVVEPAPLAATPDPVLAMAEASIVSEATAATSEPSAPTAPVEAAAPATPVARSFRRFRPAPKPDAAPEPVVDAPPAEFTATPATQPGVAWTGVIRGRSAVRVAATDPAPPSAEVVPEVSEESLTTEPVMAAAFDPIIEPPSLPIEPEPPPEVATVTPPPPPPIASDEDAAMRAIEGGWSRVGARAMSDTPELSDMGAAVAAATTAVEQVLAKAGIDVDTAGRTGRPKGLSRPRNGIKDDLKQINGLGALDESTLNNLGVYHFDQIANWNDAQVTWMENHVFARGRIGREDWQRQARELAASTAA